MEVTNMRRFWMLLWVLPATGCELLKSLEDGSSETTGDTGVTGDDDDDDNGGGGDDDDDDDNGGGGGDFSCSEGELFAGDPLWPDPMQRPEDGQGLLDTPPLLSRNLAFAGDVMFTHSGTEMWMSDVSASDPTVHRFAGRESHGQALITGPCEQARFANLFGLAMGPDDTLYISDQTANAVLRMTDPGGPACELHHMAGSTEDYESLSPSGLPNEGFVDGPGALASFAGVERIAVSDEGDVFVWDLGNAAIRKVASDGDRTVSTLVTGIGGNVQALAYLDGKLYLWGNEGGEIYLIEVDPDSGETSDIVRGGIDVFDVYSSSSVFAGGMVSDGEALIVFLNGYLFRVTPEGDIRPVAGTGVYFEYEYDYDPYVPHAANELQIISRGQVATAGANQWLGIDDNLDVYVSTLYYSPYITKVSCN